MHQQRESSKHEDDELNKRKDTEPAWTWEASAACDITYSSSSVADVLGYGPQEMVGINLLNLVASEDLDLLRETMLDISDKLTGVGGLKIRFMAEGGVSKALLITCAPKLDDQGKFAGFSGVGRDMASIAARDEQVAAPEGGVCSGETLRADELSRRATELEAILHAFPDLYFWLDSDGTIISYHALDSRELYVPPEKFLRKKMQEVLPPDAAQGFADRVGYVAKNQAQSSLEYSLPIDGKEWHFEARIVPLYDEQMLVIIRDITSRAEAEDELRRVNRALRVLSNGNQELVRATNEQELLDSICRVIVETGDYVMAWVGFAESDENKTVRPVAWVGNNDGYLQSLTITWGDDVYGHGPTGTAIKTGKTVVVDDIETDPSFAVWRDEALSRGYRCMIALPLMSDSTAFGALSIISANAEAFTESEIQLLEELAADLVYGFYALRVRQMHRKAERELRSSEERYRALVELSPEAIIVLDSERMLFVNQSAIAMFRASDSSQLLGRNLLTMVHPDDLDVAIERRSELMEKGGPIPTQELRFIRFDGSVFYGEATASTIEYAGKPALLSVIRDITDRKRSEDREKYLEDEKRQFYRATIQSVTDGKLDICDPLQLEPYATESEVRFDVLDAKDVGAARHAVEAYCAGQGLANDRLSAFMVAVGEAITNAIKHGGRGWVFAGTEDGSVYVAVRDEGPGIKSLILPRAVLLRGFSTKPSMGLGYSIMLDASDSILLDTSYAGTTVVLFKEIKEPAMEFSMDALPDTWDSIPG